MIRKVCLCILIVLVMSGCSSSPNTALVHNKDDKLSHAHELADLAEAFQARGFYKTGLSNINYLGPRKCSNFELQSHRGSVSFPENSVNSVLHALDNNFDVVEIDVMLTGSNDWIVHHDKKTGRATGTVDNVQRDIGSLQRDSYGFLRHRDPETGLLKNIVPPTFVEIAKAFSRSAAPHQELNIEIKTQARKGDLEILEYLAHSILGKGNYFYSSLELKTLKLMREINPDIYVAFIQSPSRESINVLGKSLQTGAGNDPVYLKHKDELDDYKNKANRYLKETRFDNSLKQFQTIRHALKSNYGLNLDIRHFADSNSHLIKWAKQYRVPIGTYSINSQEYHENSLMQISETYRPDTVIIDDSVYGFCNRFELPNFTPTPGAQTLGELVTSMPIDLDLNRVDELQTYSKNGLYPSVHGQLKSIYSQVNALQAEPVKMPSLKVGSRQQEQDYSLDTGKVLELELRQNQKGKVD